MAFKSKAGVIYPNEIDTKWLPIIDATDEETIRSPVLVAGLREKLKGMPIKAETDTFARLRYQGTYSLLSTDYIPNARVGLACDEFIRLLEDIRDAVARLHDALPHLGDGPSIKLAGQAKANEVKATWRQTQSDTRINETPRSTGDAYMTLLE